MTDPNPQAAAALAPAAAQLALLDRGKRALAEARTLEAVKEIRDQAEAVRHYLLQRDDCAEAALDAAELKLRAERKLGEFLGDMPKHPPGPAATDRSQGVTDPPTLEELGIDKMASSRWQRIASAIPADVFEDHLQAARASGEGLTTAALLRLARSLGKPAWKGGPTTRGPAEPLLGERWAIEQADCLDWLRRQPPASIDLVLGSPPYENSRLYLEAGQDLGIARETETWVAWMVQVVEASLAACKGLVAFVVQGPTKNYRWSGGPAYLMADLGRKGINLRSPLLYKRVGIPGSGGPDWLRRDYEWVVCCTPPGRLPWSDNTAMGGAPKYSPGGEPTHRTTAGGRVNRPTDGPEATPTERANQGPHRARWAARAEAGKAYNPPPLANPGDVIDCVVGGGNMGHPLCHENEAPFAEKLAEFLIRSFSPPGGLVADCFAGSGTTLAVAVACGRRATGCDLRASQVELTRRRLVGVQLPLNGE